LSSTPEEFLPPSHTRRVEKFNILLLSQERIVVFYSTTLLDVRKQGNVF